MVSSKETPQRSFTDVISTFPPHDAVAGNMLIPTVFLFFYVFMYFLLYCKCNVDARHWQVSRGHNSIYSLTKLQPVMGLQEVFSISAKGTTSSSGFFRLLNRQLPAARARVATSLDQNTFLFLTRDQTDNVFWMFGCNQHVFERLTQMTACFV